jgi:hypothetical protein
MSDEARKLTAEEAQTLWAQFVEVHAESQDAYDSSLRTIAAAGAAITVSLATALKGISHSGIAAVVLFLLSLGFNLASYVTAQVDMKARTRALRRREYEAVEGNRWTTATTGLNVVAGLAVLVAGGFLAWFVGTAV